MFMVIKIKSIFKVGINVKKCFYIISINLHNLKNKTIYLYKKQKRKLVQFGEET